MDPERRAKVGAAIAPEESVEVGRLVMAARSNLRAAKALAPDPWAVAARYGMVEAPVDRAAAMIAAHTAVDWAAAIAKRQI